MAASVLAQPSASEDKNVIPSIVNTSSDVPSKATCMNPPLYNHFLWPRILCALSAELPLFIFGPLLRERCASSICDGVISAATYLWPIALLDSLCCCQRKHMWPEQGPAAYLRPGVHHSNYIVPKHLDFSPLSEPMQARHILRHALTFMVHQTRLNWASVIPAQPLVEPLQGL